MRMSVEMQRESRGSNAEFECRYMKILNERADLISSIQSLTEQNGELKMLLNE
jgi:hypothetical protein